MEHKRIELTTSLLMKKVSRLRTYYLTNLKNVGINERLITGGRVFYANKIIFENGYKTLVYEEEYNPSQVRMVNNPVYEN